MAEYDHDDTAGDVRAAMEHLASGGSVPDAPAVPLDAEVETDRPSSPSHERHRDASTGRFAQRRAESQGVDESLAAARVEHAVEQRNDRQADAEQAKIDLATPPKRWGPEMRSHWQQLPPAIQRAVHTQLSADEANMAKGIENLRQTHSAYRQLDQVISPHRQSFARAGFQNDAQAVNHLMAAHAALQSNPVEAIAFLIQQAGPHVAQQLLARAGYGQAPQQQQYQQPPQYTAQQHEQMQGLHAANAEIQEFARTAKYFNEVRPQMAEIMQRGRAETLEDAYRLALSENPIYRDFTQRQHIEQKKRAAASSLSGAPHGAQPTKGYRNGAAPKSHFDDAVNSVRDALNELR